MMRKVHFLFLFIVFPAAFLTAQDYHETMKKNIQAMDTCKSLVEWLDIANKFERITLAESEKWLPPYYAAYCRVMSGMLEAKSKDQDRHYEKALQLVEQSEDISGGNSEVYALKSFVYQMQISVNPQKRGYKLGKKSSVCLKKSFKLDQDNPRAYLMKAENLFHTPKMFGGSIPKASDIFKKAVEKYDVFEPENELAPNWGKEHALDMIKKCEVAMK